MVNLNGVYGRINYQHHIHLQEEIWNKMMEDYIHYEYNQNLCTYYRELRNIEPLIENINNNNINTIIDEINGDNRLNSIIDIVLEKYSIPNRVMNRGNIDHNFLYDNNTLFKKKLLKFIDHFTIYKSYIDIDIEGYEYYIKRRTFWSWFYWLIIDMFKYLYRSIANLSNLTLKKCRDKLVDFRGLNIIAKSAPARNFLNNLNSSVRIADAIRNLYLVELNNNDTTYERKVHLIHVIRRSYHEIFSLLKLDRVMNH